LAALSVLLPLAVGASASNYFVNPFDNPVLIGPTESTTVWGVDRYAPNAFESLTFGGDNRLHVKIDDSDFQGSGFYNTQGRKLDLGNGQYTSISGDVYVSSDFDTNQRRTGIWGVAVDGSNAIVGYPILDVANDSSTAGQTTNGCVFRYYSQDTRQKPADDANATAGFVELRQLTASDYNKWHHFEIRLTPYAYEVYVDGSLVYVDNCVYGAAKFDEMILNSKNYNQDYDVYWDNVSAQPSGNPWGLPVDLNGKYFEASSGNVFSDGTAAATSNAEGFTVIESSNGVAAVQGSFTPFSSGLKPPKTLTVDMLGRSYQFKAELGGTWTLTNGIVGPNVRPGSSFIAGVHDPAGYSGAYGEVVIDRPDNTGYRFDLSTNVGDELISDTTGATKFLVRVDVDGAGTCTMVVSTVDGSEPGKTYTSNPLAAGATLANAHFYSGFDRYYSQHLGGTATVKLSEFTTTATDNAIYAFSEDPYVKPGEQASYRVGMANMTNLIEGFQAFGTATGSPTLVNLGSPFPYYTPAPFANVFLDPRTQGLSSGAAPLGASGQQASAPLAVMPYNTTVEDTATLGIAENNGNVNFPTRFSINGGQELLPGLRQGSNTVVVDNTAPSVSIVSATQSHGNVLSSTAIQGLLTVHIDAKDTGATQSGLAGYPSVQITWSDSSVTTLGAAPWAGDDYIATTNIGPSVPCGTATILVTATDDAGHVSTTTGTFSVNKSQVTATVQLAGVTSSPNREVTFVLGGTGGSNGPITVHKALAFTAGSATVTLTALDGLPDCSKTMTVIWAKDEVHTLGKRENLTKDVNAQYTCPTIVLKGGNANKDSVIDILDYGKFAFQWGSSQSVNSLYTDPGNADFNCNGTVEIGDYSYIQLGFLSSDELLPGNFSPVPTPKDKCTVKEMITSGVPEPVAQAMDADRDGWITVNEVSQWLSSKQKIFKNGGR